MKTENLSLCLASNGDTGKGVIVEKWEQKSYQNRFNECMNVSYTKIYKISLRDIYKSLNKWKDTLCSVTENSIF